MMIGVEEQSDSSGWNQVEGARDSDSQACRAEGEQGVRDSLVDGLEEKWVNDEDGVHMCSSLAGLNQGRVVMQTESLQAQKQGQERVCFGVAGADTAQVPALLWLALWVKDFVSIQQDSSLAGCEQGFVGLTFLNHSTFEAVAITLLRPAALHSSGLLAM
jgi:hypothetical protein